MLIATKGGLTRHGPGRLAAGRPAGIPAPVRADEPAPAEASSSIDLWQLHRIDPKVPRDEQFGVIADMLKEGLIRHAGLSEVSVEEIEAARKVFPVATVQNRYNLVDRTSEAVLDYCAANDIGFIPWFPLAAGNLAKPGTALDAIAHKAGATPSQVALAWVLKRSPVMLPIPGTSKVDAPGGKRPRRRDRALGRGLPGPGRAGQGDGLTLLFSTPAGSEILPGLRMSCGSSAALIAAMVGMAEPSSSTNRSRLPRPTPCSPVQVPSMPMARLAMA